MARVTCLLLLGCLLSCCMANTLESLVRRNTPKGHTFSAFVEICESCGEYFGNSLSYRCIMDRSLTTFRQCNTAVVSVNRRR
ncbi:hypothetical protein KP79_PYT00509 [Mizuhopecten yessoensis]|uniref:Uncharacterized protein n=1 Tax=Mizuhopecten yessoensis TaxID=6573 RepID=A0A210QWE0_MIZYE|nr:hypothetical protein KP79_PYT00509 [Mizuhopecten yessoensis]